MAMSTTNTYFHIRQALTEIGFSSLNDFLAAHPGATYESLAEKLGGIAPQGIVNFQRQIAKKEGTWEAFVRDVIVRDAPNHLEKRGKLQDDFLILTIVRAWAEHIGTISDELTARLRETFSRQLADKGTVDLECEESLELIREVAAATA